MFASRGLSQDGTINVTISVLTILIAILSAILAWATWRLTRRRGHRHRQSMSPTRLNIEGIL